MMLLVQTEYEKQHWFLRKEIMTFQGKFSLLWLYGFIERPEHFRNFEDLSTIY